MSDRGGLGSTSESPTNNGPWRNVGRQGDFDGGRPRATHTALTEASALLNGDRHDQYGDARVTHERIAAMWNAIVPQGRRITASDVALMMIAVKSIRASKNPKHRDSWVDIAGYAEIGSQLNDVEQA